MSISVIVPMYNVQEYLEECLNSLLNNQSDFEVLLIDDGSIDNTKGVALSFVEKYPDIFFYYYKENGGLGDARNFAIPLATKEYLFFLDSDDFLKDCAIDILNRLLEEKEIDLLVFNLNTYYSASKNEVCRIYNRDSMFISSNEYLNGIPAAWNKVIKKGIMIKNNIYFPRSLWYEDLATTPVYASYAKKIYYLNDTLYYYRQRESSIMNQISFNPKMMDIVVSLDKIYDPLKNAGNISELEDIYIKQLLFHHAIRLLNFNRTSEIELCIKEILNKFPNWKENSYFRKQTFGYRFFCNSIMLKKWRVCKLLVWIKYRN